MNKKALLFTFFATCASLLAAREIPADSLTQTASEKSEKTSKKIWNAFDPSIKFSGYIIGKYSIDNQEGKASNSTFDLRFVRLSASGYCFNDFYYRLQVEINGMPSKDNGPRIMDAFVEWQKFDFLRVKLGQFKRPIGFENPMSPLDVGLGNYSQATLKLASINDRIDGHKCSGRDVGVQLQGDLFPATDGHNWLHYQVGVFNGQGINHTDKDNFKDVIGGLWLSPVKGLSVGGFGWNGKYTNDDYKGDGTDLESVERKRWGVGYMYDNGAWSTRGEYIASKGKNPADIHSANRSDAWYVQVGAPLFKDFKLFGRYDCYRENKHWNSLKTIYALAANYYLGKHLIFQANYSFTNDRSAAIGRNYSTFDVQVAARF